MSTDDGVFVHPSALVETDQIGSGTRVWAFAHVMKGAKIGRGCNVGDHAFIESGVTIGDDAVIKNGVSIWDGVTIEDRVFVGPNAAFTNDLVPRAKAHRDTWDPTLVREGASLGANATIVCGHTIGRYALVGAGAVVTKDVPDFGLVVGNPGRLIGFVCRCGQRLTFEADCAVCTCGRRFRRTDQRVEEEEL